MTAPPESRVDLPEPVMSAEELTTFLRQWFPAAEDSFRIEEVTAGGVAIRLPIHERHGRPGGTVSGPTMMTLADSVAWLATLSRIGPEPLAVTANLTIDFLRKPPPANFHTRGACRPCCSRSQRARWWWCS